MINQTRLVILVIALPFEAPSSHSSTLADCDQVKNATNCTCTTCRLYIHGHQIAPIKEYFTYHQMQSCNILNWITRLTTQTRMYVLHLYVYYVTN